MILLVLKNQIILLFYIFYSLFSINFHFKHLLKYEKLFFSIKNIEKLLLLYNGINVIAY